MKLLSILLGCFIMTSSLYADYVYNAKSKTHFTKIGNDKILFRGGYGPDFLVKVSGLLPLNINRLIILKDSFGSYESKVLVINDEVFDVSQVDKID